MSCSQCGAELPNSVGISAGAPGFSDRPPSPYTPRHLVETALASSAARDGERKHATVLFCDIVQSTALVRQLGAEGFHDLISDFFEAASRVVHRFEGTINQFLGDGFMALFGAPIAYEDHTRRAVLAALELRAEVASTLENRGVEIRIGISRGFVVVGGIGTDLRRDYTAFGDTTALAARLQAAGAPWDILLNADAAERVRPHFQLSEPLTFTVKDLKLTAHRVLGTAQPTSLWKERRSLTPFVGRDAELEALTDALSGIQDGMGKVIAIVGEPGLGKSRLSKEFSRRLSSFVVHEGRCISYGAAIPYLPVIDLLHRSCGIEPADGQAVVARKLQATLDRLALEPDPALPFLLQLLGQSDTTTAVAQLDPATVKARTFEALRDLWRAESTEFPLVLILEDLHWIDKTSEEFLATFVDALPRMRILLLISYRSGYAPPWSHSTSVSSIALQPLSDNHSREIVSAVLAQPSKNVDADALTDSIVATGEGNPFFLEELARSKLQQGTFTANRLPETVEEVLAARIDSLGEGPKRLLQTASVLGRHFSLAVAGALYGSAEDAIAHVSELERVELLFEHKRDSTEIHLAFKHALTQEVAYASMLDRRRRELHGRAGRALERLHADSLNEHCELLAYHYARSNETDKAAEYLILANRKAAQGNAMQEAIGYFYEALRALEALPDDDTNRRRRLRLVFDQTGEFHFLHRHQEYFDLIASCKPLTLRLNDQELLGAFYARLGHRQWTSNQIEQSVPTLMQAAELCDSCGNSIDAAGAYAILAWAHWSLGQLSRVLAYRNLALGRLQNKFHPVWYSFTRGVTILGYTSGGQWADAVNEGELAIEDGRARGDRAIVAFSAAWVAYLYVERRE